MRVVVESPLSGDHVRNYRYLLWCCRAAWLEDEAHAISSHMLNPWYMDDTNQTERQAGIDNPWVWDPRVPHWFFMDLGMSGGMRAAEARIEYDLCARNASRPVRILYLAKYAPACWEAFERGEWPPHTPGFEVSP